MVGSLALLIRVFLGQNRTEPLFRALVILLSTIFVAWHIPAYLMIMLISIAVDYWAAVKIGKMESDDPRRRLYLWASLGTNLGLLAFFKYTNFAMESLEQLAQMAGHPVHLPRSSLPLPMGISFYTFCSMSYTIDVYRDKIQTSRNFIDFYFFITFFPHLVAGPIIRAEQFIYQYYRKRKLRLKVFSAGCYFLIRGLFLKMVCADNIGYLLQGIWPTAYKGTLSCGSCWAMAILFSAQIFYDFEGYTSIARGLAYIFGFRFPENFNNPYLANTFKNFWERWHITLSSWLRDYLYVALGGNRVGKVRTYVNLMLVMLLGGLWHGANATFVIWGFLHGAGLAIERLLGFHRPEKLTRLTQFLWFGIVQLIVLFAWVLFRSEHLKGGGRIISTMLALDDWSLLPSLWTNFLLLLPIISMHLYGFAVERGWLRPLSQGSKAALAGLMLYLTLVAYGINNDFIYFAF